MAGATQAARGGAGDCAPSQPRVLPLI